MMGDGIPTAGTDDAQTLRHLSTIYEKTLGEDDRRRLAEIAQRIEIADDVIGSLCRHLRAALVTAETILEFDRRPRL